MTSQEKLSFVRAHGWKVIATLPAMTEAQASEVEAWLDEAILYCTDVVNWRISDTPEIIREDGHRGSE